MYICVCVFHTQESSLTRTTVMHIENKPPVMLIYVISHHQSFSILLTLKMLKSAQWFPKPLAYTKKLVGSVIAHPYISKRT